MTTAATLEVEVRGKDVDASKLLDNIERRLQQLDKSAGTTGANFGRQIGSGARQASSGVLSLAQADARLLRDQGNLAASADRLRNALAGQSNTTVQVINARRQLLSVENQLATGQSRLTQAITAAGNSAKSSIAGMIGPAALATAAIGGLIKVAESFENAFNLKTQLDATTNAINLQLRGVRDSATVWAQAQTVANRYNITQSETAAILQNSTGILRNSKAGADELITTLLRLQTLAPEKPIDEAARALRELASGDTTTIKELFNISARDANRMKEEIIGGKDAVAVLSGFLSGAGAGMDVLAQRTEGAAAKMLELKRAQEELTLAQAEFAQGPGMAILEGKIETIRGATRLLSGDFAEMGQSIANAASTGDSFLTVLAGAIGLNTTALSFLGQATTDYTNTTAQSTQATAQNTQAVAANALTMDAERQAVVAAEQALQEQSAALVEQTQKTLESKLEAQQLAAFQTTLANLAGAVSGGHLSNAQAAGQLANMYGIATDAAYRLIQAQAQLGQASGPVNVAFGGNAFQSEIDRIKASNKAYGDRQDALEDQALAVGDAASQQKVYNDRLLRAQREFGQYSEEAIRAETALKQFQQRQEEANKPRGGRGGGSTPGISNVKLTDQQKLDNQLLAEQDKFQDRFEDAETDHLLKVLEINKDFAEKIQEAQRDFQQSNLDSRASFYDNLGDIEDAGLRQNLAAQYEQAFAEAQQIAQTKGADVADAFLQAKQQALEAQAQRASEIAAAEKDNDKGKADYLRGVDELYRQAEEERLRRIQEGNDSIAAQRDAALQEEADRYGAAQDEIAGKADSSAQRRIDAALRAGKAIDAERLQVDQLAASYDRLNTQSGGVATSTAPDAPQGTSEAPQGAAGGAGILEALNAVRAAVDNAATMIVRAEQDTTRALRSAANSGGVAG